MGKPLKDKQIEDELSKLPKDWFITGDGKLSREFEFDSFTQARKFISKLAKKAEKLDHHPSVNWEYTKISFSVTTHESGGLTQKDFALARAAEKCL